MNDNHQLAERVAKLEERDEANRNVLRELAHRLEDLAESVMKLRLTIATAIGAATVLMPVLTWALPKWLNKLWP